ncbi:putative NBD/HSP70 family sugar kinase/transcriptional regulator with XRE-family HTH domain [Pseudarthrobacter defluvii]|uniref:ROK family protein n=1 Tax=Pseudarthrobacter defluvii TaxID=410837 RepID=UPI00278A1867|nr:ROK family protein [Pseudarthrobacter defluvii]MDQ0767272.1 putative NBD/HSP70 family sugar kinase/transcriptional regulator with XRE-family HTH domain [Pseudarthrobacter defluvii]
MATESHEPQTVNYAETDEEFEELLAQAEADPNAARLAQETMQRLEFLSGVQQWRREKHLSQKALASLLGTTQSAVSDFESGRVDPQLSTLQRYARALDARFDFKLVNPDSPLPAEASTNARFAQETALTPLLTTLVRQSDEQARTLKSLAEAMLLPEPVIRPLLSILQAEGWARGVGEGPERVYSLVDEIAYVIGISLERDQIVGVLMNLDGQAMRQVTSSYPEGKTSQATISAAADVVEQLCHASDRRILGVGVSVAGVVDPKVGRVDYAPELQSELDPWSGIELGNDLEEEISRRLPEPLKVAVENDANALAAWEYLRRGDDSVAVALLSGTGIGAGFVMEGKLFHGAHSAAGESGHTLVDHEGLPCRAGHEHRGCLETMASIEGILGRLGIPAGTSEQRTAGLIIANERISNGDERSQTALHNAGKAYGRFLATTVLLFDPERAVTYIHPYLASREYACARAFQDGVQSALSEASSSRLSVAAPPRYEWHALDDLVRATAAGATGLWNFLKHPIRWAPSLLASQEVHWAAA